jgi:hypothetical protein
MLEFGFFFIFHLLPLDNWDWCKTGILKVQLWTIMVIVNIRFLYKLYYDKEKQFKSMKFYIWKQQSWTLSHLIDERNILIYKRGNRRPIDRQYNGQKNKDKWTHNNIQYTTQKTKDCVLRALLNTGGEIRSWKLPMYIRSSIKCERVQDCCFQI